MQLVAHFSALNNAIFAEININNCGGRETEYREDTTEASRDTITYQYVIKRNYYIIHAAYLIETSFISTDVLLIYQLLTSKEQLCLHAW